MNNGHQFYCSDEVFEKEIKEIFNKQWLLVAHISELPNPGDFITIDKNLKSPRFF